MAVMYDDESDVEMTLDLGCWDDELSEAQLAAYEKTKADITEIKTKLNNLVCNYKGEQLYSGTFFNAYEFKEEVKDLEELDKYAANFEPPPPRPEPKGRNSVARNQKSNTRGKRKSYVIVESDEEELPLAKRVSKPTDKYREVKKESPVSREKEKKIPAKPAKPIEKTVTNLRPSEASSIGGLTIGTKQPDPKHTGPDSKEVTFNKAQGKTFPSLVVVARPSLNVKENSAAERSALDSKVKIVLMLSAAKFAEWLIQQGLLKSEQKCSVHQKQDLKLGVYSDASKFPYSGGYVWISECCQSRFVSVFHGSLFEGAPHPPSYILKLLYHWACQTNVQNVVQWVKVDNMYIKGIYTWLRAVCTLALQQHLKPMGGGGKYIEVGVISLGTTTQDGQKRQVKVEVLGVLDNAGKIIRLRAIEPFSDSNDKNYKRRFQKILEPLAEYVSKDSTIVTDLTVDRATLAAMGYNKIIQSAPTDKTAKFTNANVMDYLRRIVPRMFQNTLSLLSRPMIQQFLDELVWREQFGGYPLQTFDNINKHIAEQTRGESGETLLQKLYKVATNPFRNWTHEFGWGRPEQIKKKKPTAKETPVQIKATPKGTPTSKGVKTTKFEPKPSTSTSAKKVLADDDNVGFEEYFYGQLEVKKYISVILDDIDVKCPECLENFPSNIHLQDHIFAHIFGESSPELLCKYCLEKSTDAEALKKHIHFTHPIAIKNALSLTYNCLICENRFNSIQLLITHTTKVHVGRELPYKCFACNFKSSSHRLNIDHFYKKHKEGEHVQCPYCLLAFRIYAENKPLDQNIVEYVKHLRKHQELHKSLSPIKCTKCILSFVTKGALKAHNLFEHKSVPPNNRDLKKLLNNTTFIQSPKNRSHTAKETSTFKNSQTFKALDIPDSGNLCLECDVDLSEENHLIGYLQCQKCMYKTCCVRAILEHTTSCEEGVNPESNVHIQLDREMHCVCGFSSLDGNSMARHLVICEHKSAYPTLEAAQENIVKRNMLEMLGLERRSDEGGDSSAVGTSQPSDESNSNTQIDLENSEVVANSPDTVQEAILVDSTEDAAVSEQSESAPKTVVPEHVQPVYEEPAQKSPEAQYASHQSANFDVESEQVEQYDLQQQQQQPQEQYPYDPPLAFEQQTPQMEIDSQMQMDGYTNAPHFGL